MDLQEPQSLQRIPFSQVLRNTAGGGISQNGHQHHARVQQRQDSNPPRVTETVSVLPMHAYCPWLLLRVDGVAVIEPLSAGSSLKHHPPSPHCSSSSIPSPLSQHNPWPLWGCYFPPHKLCRALSELTCVEQCGWKSFFLMSWCLTGFLYLFQNQNKKSSFLICLLHLCWVLGFFCFVLFFPWLQTKWSRGCCCCGE